MPDLPHSITLLFIVTTLLTIFLFFKANPRRIVLFILLGWIIVQALIAVRLFYVKTDEFPPRFMLLVLPPLLLIIVLFISPAGRRYIDNFDLRRLTILHIVRIPVELVLYWLSVAGKVPQLMTFEGRNFDILSGLSAPLIYYFCLVKPYLSQKVLVIWNIVCLLLLLNIVVNAVLSAPFPFQQFAFDQPNIAVLYFPFVWLPCCIVPIVLFSHLAAFRILSVQEKRDR